MKFEAVNFKIHYSSSSIFTFCLYKPYPLHINWVDQSFIYDFILGPLKKGKLESRYITTLNKTQDTQKTA